MGWFFATPSRPLHPDLRRNLPLERGKKGIEEEGIGGSGEWVRGRRERVVWVEMRGEGEEPRPRRREKEAEAAVVQQILIAVDS